MIIMSKSVRLQVLIDEFEKEKLRMLADASGSTMGEVVRQLIRKAKIKQTVNQRLIV